MAKHALNNVEGFKQRKDFFTVDPRSIKVIDGWNPRTDFDGEEDLTASIVANGVQVPLRVKKVDNELHLIDGERRLRATLRAIAEGNEIQAVPVILERRTISDIEALIVSLITNDGKPLEPIEEAQAIARLVAWGLKVEDIARRMGRSKVFVYERLKLVDASPELQTAIRNKDVSVKTAAKIVSKSGGSTEKQNQGIAKAKTASKITVSWDKRTSAAKIKSPGANDDFCQLADVFNKDFLLELKERGADLKTLKVTFKRADQDEDGQIQTALEGF